MVGGSNKDFEDMWGKFDKKIIEFDKKMGYTSANQSDWANLLREINTLKEIDDIVDTNVYSTITTTFGGTKVNTKVYNKPKPKKKTPSVKKSFDIFSHWRIWLFLGATLSIIAKIFFTTENAKIAAGAFIFTLLFVGFSGAYEKYVK